MSAWPEVIAHKDPKLPPALAIPAGLEWVGMLNVLGAAVADLMAAMQTLYPHDGLSVTPYRRALCRLDQLAAGAQEAGRLLTGFGKLLAETKPLPFRELAESYRVQALKQLETTPEFRIFQRMAARFLYDDVEVWAAFGYQGAAVHLGGYVARGFDDLAWLPPLPNDI